MDKKDDLENEIRKLYLKFLGRITASHEIDYWINQIESGKINSEQLPTIIQSSEEAHNFKLESQKNQPDAINICRTKLDGHILYLDLNDEVSIIHYDQTNFDEKGTTSLLKKLLTKGMNVINIGAHIGYYTLLAARQVGSQGKIYSFEPFPDTVKVLEKNISSNGYENVEIFQMAVSNKTGTAILQTGASALVNIISKKEMKEMTEMKVSVTTIDDFLEGKNTQIDFMIVDAEGSEQFILEGMKKTLEKNPLLEMIVEYNPFTLKLAGTNANSFLSEIEKNGFIIYIIDEINNTVKSIDKAALLRQVVSSKITNLYLTRNNQIS